MIDAEHQPALANPFFHRGPIRRPEYFFNRETEITLAMELLRNLQNVALIGQRRVGKTSLLFHLVRPEVHTRHDLPADQYLFVYLDGEELLNSDPGQVRRAIIEELVLTLEAAGHEPTLLAKGSDVLDSERLEYRAFRRLLRQVTTDNHKVIFCLDEFDCLAANPHLGHSFYSGLRALASQFDLAFVTASKGEVQALSYANEDTLSSPFFNTFATLHLGLFSRQGGRGLVRHLASLEGIHLPPDMIDAILRLAGPHPLFLQIAAFHALDQWRKGQLALAAEEWDQIDQRFLAEVEPHYDYYWQQLTEAQRYVLATLPLVESRTGQENALRQLERHCLVYRQDGRWFYLSSSLEAFVRRQSVPELLQAGSLLLDLRQRQGFWQQSILALTKTEFNALAHFIRHPDQVISTQELEETLWPGEYINDPERIRSLIKSLRKSLGEAAACLETVWGVGFRFKSSP